MIKTFHYQIERIIEYTEIEEDYVVFSDKRLVGGKEIDKIEGIALKSDVEKVSGSVPIKKETFFLLVHRDGLIDLNKRTWSQSQDYLKEMDAVVRENLYEIVKSEGREHYCLLCISFVDGHVYNAQKKRLAKGVMFDYSRGGIDNGRYDLKEIWEMLKDRDDVTLLSKGIESIPYYNCSEGCSKHIRFMWNPSQEQFDLVSDESSSHAMEEAIKAKMLKFPERSL